jgi:CreA protein
MQLRDELKHIAIVAALLALLGASPVFADELDCASTTFRIMGANDKVCVSGFDDEKVGGVTCYVAQARTGGVKGMVGVAEDPSRFSLSCNQTGPITADLTKLRRREEVYSERTSLFFKSTHVYRIVDPKRHTLVYLAISDKIVDGSPYNAVSSVPVMPWNGH